MIVVVVAVVVVISVLIVSVDDSILSVVFIVVVVVVFKLKVLSVEDSILFVIKAVVRGCLVVCESSRVVSFFVTELFVSFLVVVVFPRKTELDGIKSLKSLFHCFKRS